MSVPNYDHTNKKTNSARDDDGVFHGGLILALELIHRAIIRNHIAASPIRCAYKHVRHRAWLF